MEAGERPGLIHSDTLSLEAELPEALIPPEMSLPTCTIPRPSVRPINIPSSCKYCLSASACLLASINCGLGEKQIREY